MVVASAERNMLFGLLALQNGLINQGQLVAAFQAWTLDKAKSLADHLEAHGDLTGAKRALLEALAGVHLEAHGGDVERSLAAVSAGKSMRASLAELGDPDIEGTLGHVASGHGSPDNGDAQRTSTYAVGAATSDGQRFRVLRPHARGGLGAVFVALDTELHREVALKQILDAHADDPDSRQRFLLEAEVTGSLEHPGIVPVYGLGTYRDGRPYYAMRFVGGDSLKEAVERFHADESLKTHLGRHSLELRQLLRRFLDICNAIEYAHSRGVLHRDIKPGNVIVGRHGETLMVDWGLAKATGKSDPAGGERTLRPSSASGSAETLPGSALGTPAYMSPEQAAGKLLALGPRSDIYSLGATLYCLLTGRPPFAGEAVEVIPAVQKGQFLPPRALDPSIDRALEAVCLKAMALQPEERYGSCRALAEDIERWLADEPVTAWPEPFTRRARRWMQRNRTAVAAAVVALVAGVVGLGAVSGLQARANGALRKAHDATTKALGETREAKRATDVALGESRRLLAQLALDRALGLCEQGHADYGLLWLARGLQLAPARASELQRLLRLSLDGWRHQVHPVRAILEHQAQVLTVAIRPDGQAMLTGGYDYVARLWDAQGKPLADPWQHESAVGTVIFGPDGKSVLTLSYAGVAQLWDVASGKHLGKPIHERVHAVAWSRDGKAILTGSWDQTARLWDAVTQKSIGGPMKHDGLVNAVAFSPDSKTVLTGSYDHTARLWDATTGRPIGKTMKHGDQVIAVAFSPDGKTALTASFDHTARLWDAVTGLPRREPLWHPEMVYAAAFSPDGKTVLTGGGERVGRLWEAATGKPVGPPLPHRGGVSLVGFSPDGRVAITGSSDNTARLWDVATGLPLGAPLQHQGFLQSAAFRPDGRLVLTGSYDRTARLWETATGPHATLLRHEGRIAGGATGHEPTTSTRGHELRIPGLITVAVFSPDSRTVLTGDWEGTARLWDTTSGKRIGKTLQHVDPITSAAFHPDSKTVVIASGKAEIPRGKTEFRDDEVIRRGEARIWNVADGTPSSFSMRHESEIRALAYSPDGRIILTGSRDRTARLWDAATGKPLSPPLKHEQTVHTAAFNPDGKVALTADQDVTRRWDVATGKLIDPPLRHHANLPVMDLAFRRDGQAVLVGLDNHTARIYGTTSGQLLCPPLRHQGMVAAVAFSPDGRLAVTGSQDATARIWEVATGKPIGEPLRHQGQVLDVAFSPDGKTVLSAGYDDVVQLWDVATGRPIGPPWMHPIFGRFVNFSPDGQYALTLTGGDVGRNTARLWKIPTPVEGDAERIALWVQGLTGMELDSGGAALALDAAAWQARLRDLQQLGGPPIPFDPAD
jgi:WD40 repeat protein/serine/threonine protein kinase